jgi:hypothetical protein
VPGVWQLVAGTRTFSQKRKKILDKHREKDTLTALNLLQDRVHKQQKAFSCVDPSHLLV